MISTGDVAPDFTAPLATGDIESFTLSENLDEAPLVLAFFPGAFTSVCTHEMNTFEERLDEFEATGASVVGVSIDTPFALNEFREELDLTFGLLSDTNRELVQAYDIAIDSPELGIDDLANRAVFVIEEDGSISYAWVSEDPTNEPDYDAVIGACSPSAQA